MDQPTRVRPRLSLLGPDEINLACAEMDEPGDERRTGELLAEAEPPEDHDELLARGEAFLRSV